jgi:cytidyltransferase-like protein
MPASFLDKLCPREDLVARVAALARPIVFTNGVFDILHRGHVSYLAEARALGAALVLGLNSDASARRLARRPTGR